MYKYLIVLLLITKIILLNSCAPKEQHYQKAILSFGTVIKIDIISTKNLLQIQEIFTQIENLIKLLHVKWHPWEQTSDIYKINYQLQNHQKIIVDNNILAILTTAKTVNKLSNGLFNPCIGKLIAAYGFHTEQFAQNTKINNKIIKDYYKHPCDFSNLNINKNIINLKQPDQNFQLDLSGIAKGQAMLMIKNIMYSNGIKKALINIGGDLYALGQPAPNRAWKIAVKNPNLNINTPVEIIDLLPNHAMATSGNYLRKFKLNQKLYSHIINPKLLNNINNNINSVTVIHKNPLIADAAATAIMLMQPKDYYKFTKILNIEKMIII